MDVIKIRLDKYTKETFPVSQFFSENFRENFYDIDAFVELACPRIAIDDFAKYDRPLVTFKEAMCGLGEVTWEELLEDGLI